MSASISSPKTVTAMTSANTMGVYRNGVTTPTSQGLLACFEPTECANYPVNSGYRID